VGWVEDPAKKEEMGMLVAGVATVAAVDVDCGVGVVVG